MSNLHIHQVLYHQLPDLSEPNFLGMQYPLEPRYNQNHPVSLLQLPWHVPLFSDNLNGKL
ncbi:hypothetical protein MtrunA17_Chr1g0199521 [Medicago truncatula]|uniref:Uncharacterized protein n=1 Tax=Medicago truncatula TaxID=3880 RepID=A0A396JW08_MEDTR|nr:hypothetical protein MtrunA17_Chr1g0199521 [Medicago truncatula]